MLHAPTLDAPFGKAHHGPAPTGGGPPSVPSAAACVSDGQASAVASPWGVRGDTFFAVPGAAAAAPDSDGGVGVALGASAGASVASGGLGDRWSMCGSGTSIGGSSGYSSDEEDELSTCGVADAAQDRWEAAWGDHHAITSEHGDGTDSPGARRCPPANSDARDCAWTLAWDAVLDRPLYSNSVTFQVQWHHPFPDGAWHESRCPTGRGHAWKYMGAAPITAGARPAWVDELDATTGRVMFRHVSTGTVTATRPADFVPIIRVHGAPAEVRDVTGTLSRLSVGRGHSGSVGSSGGLEHRARFRAARSAETSSSQPAPTRRDDSLSAGEMAQAPQEGGRSTSGAVSDGEGSLDALGAFVTTTPRPPLRRSKKRTRPDAHTEASESPMSALCRVETGASLEEVALLWPPSGQASDRDLARRCRPRLLTPSRLSVGSPRSTPTRFGAGGGVAPRSALAQRDSDPTGAQDSPARASSPPSFVQFQPSRHGSASVAVPCPVASCDTSASACAPHMPQLGLGAHDRPGVSFRAAVAHREAQRRGDLQP